MLCHSVTPTPVGLMMPHSCWHYFSQYEYQNRTEPREGWEKDRNELTCVLPLIGSHATVAQICLSVVLLGPVQQSGHMFGFNLCCSTVLTDLRLGEFILTALIKIHNSACGAIYEEHFYGYVCSKIHSRTSEIFRQTHKLETTVWLIQFQLSWLLAFQRNMCISPPGCTSIQGNF